MSCNSQKTVCIVFQPKRRDRIVASVPPPALRFVSMTFSSRRHLGHVMNNSLTDDDDDINRAVKKFVHANECIDASVW